MNNPSVNQTLLLVSVGPVLFCLVVSWIFISFQKPRLGLFLGLAILVLLLLAAEAWVYTSCVQCRSTSSFPLNTLCCEWTGVGMVLYAVIGSIDAAAFSLVYLAIAWFYRHYIYKAENKPEDLAEPAA